MPSPPLKPTPRKLAPLKPVQPRIPAKGLLLLAIGRKTGFDHFGTDGDAYLGSLAPLLAMILVTSAWMGLRDAGWHHAASLCLRLTCMLLAPAVVAELFCRVWKRNGQWALYANLLNWTQWLSWFVLLVAVFVAEIGISAGLGQPAATALAGVAMLIYLIWFHWFLARQTLGVSRGRVFLLLTGSALVTMAIGAVALFDPQDKDGSLMFPGKEQHSDVIIQKFPPGSARP